MKQLKLYPEKHTEKPGKVYHHCLLCRECECNICNDGRPDNLIVCPTCDEDENGEWKPDSPMGRWISKQKK